MGTKGEIILSVVGNLCCLYTIFYLPKNGEEYHLALTLFIVGCVCLSIVIIANFKRKRQRLQLNPLAMIQIPTILWVGLYGFRRINQSGQWTVNYFTVFFGLYLALALVSLILSGRRESN